MALWSFVLSTICIFESILWCFSNYCFIRGSFGAIFISKVLQTWYVRKLSKVYSPKYLFLLQFKLIYISERSLYTRFYWSLIGLSWFNSIIFATPPLFGYGKYSCDTTGTSCTFLWPSASSGAKHIGFSIPYIVVCGVIPVIAL